MICLLFFLIWFIHFDYDSNAGNGHQKCAENQNSQKRGFNTGSYVFNTCHLWIWIMCRAFLTVSHPPTDSLYRKRLSIDGRQLNLEVFDPCSQVKHVTNTSKCFVLFFSQRFFCFMSCASLMVSNHSVCLISSWNECNENRSQWRTQHKLWLISFL